MRILGIDSSAKSASAAITENGKIISSFYINTGLTHSQTLIPMIENTLSCAGISFDDIDLIAVNNGPGSFTGIRIGVAAAKGIADYKKLSCIGVSTLESIANNLIDFDCIACAVMDARCNQVYMALFDISDGKIIRLCKDSAVSIDELKKILKNYKKNKILVGDGADICYNAIGKNDAGIILAGELLRFQNAAGVCFAAAQHEKSSYVCAAELVPEYLRLPQAQRELRRDDTNAQRRSFG